MRSDMKRLLLPFLAVLILAPGVSAGPPKYVRSEVVAAPVTITNDATDHVLLSTTVAGYSLVGAIVSLHAIPPPEQSAALILTSATVTLTVGSYTQTVSIRGRQQDTPVAFAAVVTQPGDTVVINARTDATDLTINARLVLTKMP